MKVRTLMTPHPVHVAPDAPIPVAARLLEHYNIGALPVCASDGALCGILTDRDLAIRALTAQTHRPLRVEDVMTRQVRYIAPDMEASAAAGIMGREQLRRLPVVEEGSLCGMLSLGDLATHEDSSIDAGDALSEISSPLSSR